MEESCLLEDFRVNTSSFNTGNLNKQNKVFKFGFFFKLELPRIILIMFLNYSICFLDLLKNEIFLRIVSTKLIVYELHLAPLTKFFVVPVKNLLAYSFN